MAKVTQIVRNRTINPKNKQTEMKAKLATRPNGCLGNKELS